MKSNKTKWLISATSVICLWGVASAQGTPPDSVEKSPPTVAMPFFVDDGRGNAMTEIALADLSILDDKKAPQRVVVIHTAKDMPLRLGLLIDNSGSQRGSGLYAAGAKAAFDFLNSVFSGPDDKVFVAGFAKESGGTGFLNKGDFLKLRFTLAPAGGTALYDAIQFASAERMAADSIQPTRRVLVILTDGDDNRSHISLASAIASAQNSETVIFTVGTGARYQRSPFETIDVDTVLEQLASETGGLSFSGLAPKDLPRVFATIKARIDHLDSVSYVPAEATRHFHSVELKIASDKKWKIHVAKGYIPTAQ